MWLERIVAARNRHDPAAESGFRTSMFGLQQAKQCIFNKTPLNFRTFVSEWRGDGRIRRDAAPFRR
jgi:hypothetical protein